MTSQAKDPDLIVEVWLAADAAASIAVDEATVARTMARLPRRWQGVSAFAQTALSAAATFGVLAWLCGAQAVDAALEAARASPTPNGLTPLLAPLALFCGGVWLTYRAARGAGAASAARLGPNRVLLSGS